MLGKRLKTIFPNGGSMENHTMIDSKKITLNKSKVQGKLIQGPGVNKSLVQGTAMFSFPEGRRRIFFGTFGASDFGVVELRPAFRKLARREQPKKAPLSRSSKPPQKIASSYIIIYPTNRDHFVTSPNNALLQTKSLKCSIHLHCLISPK